MAGNAVTVAADEYRRCVGIILLNQRGEVLVAQRIDMPTAAWQMPQGGIDENDEPPAATFRELKGEIGTDRLRSWPKAKADLLRRVSENLHRRAASEKSEE